MIRPAAVLLALSLAGCAQPVPQPRYMVGDPYQMGGVWSYPREDFGLVQTGLAATIPDTRRGRRTTNGEIFDPAQLMAQHRTLQLPAVIRVTNLETGLEVELRVNDRGPPDPGRVVGLSARAAQLLGIGPGQAAQVRVGVVGDASRALAAGLPSPDVPRLQIATAPLGSVQREDLAPPPGATQAAATRQARPLPGAGLAQAGPAAGPTAPPERLPERVNRVPPQPGRLYVETATFGRRDLAERQAARIGGRVEVLGPRGRQSFRVRVGPIPTVAEADRTLERTLRAGVSEARIIVD